MLKLFFFCASLFVGSLGESVDGGKAPRIPLNDGNSIPAIGLGTFLGFDENGQKSVEKDEVVNAVKWGLDAGYRLIDTAALYYTEEQIGEALRQSEVPRENVFIVTKMAITEQKPVVDALKDSLHRLNQSYVDLYLIHFPVSFTPDYSEFVIKDYVDTWKGMEEAKTLGLAKSIGVSNFNVSQMERLLDNSDVKPAVLQVEVNLNLGQDKIIGFCKDNDVTVMAYTPFGRLFEKDTTTPAPKIDDPTLTEMAKKYGKTPAQIVLRYLMQRGVVPIPKSVHKNRIEQNIDVFNFQLTPEEMDTLSKFNNNSRTVLPSFWQDHPYYPFEKVDVPRPNPFLPKTAKSAE